MTPEDLALQIADFIEHRASIKRPMSAVAIRRLTKRAERFNARGVDMIEVFDKAITSGWQSIYLPKDAQNKPASHRITELPDYGVRSEPTAARANVASLRAIVKKG